MRSCADGKEKRVFSRRLLSSNETAQDLQSEKEIPESRLAVVTTFRYGGGRAILRRLQILSAHFQIQFQPMTRLLAGDGPCSTTLALKCQRRVSPLHLPAPSCRRSLFAPPATELVYFAHTRPADYGHCRVSPRNIEQSEQCVDCCAPRWIWDGAEDLVYEMRIPSAARHGVLYALLYPSTFIPCPLVAPQCFHQHSTMPTWLS